MEGLAGQVAIVTGAADGLGRATSRAMAAKGMRVLLVDIDAQRLAETEALIRDAGGEAAVFRADVSEEAQVRGYVAKAISRFGRIDAFFNNAGILGAVEPIIDYPIGQTGPSSGVMTVDGYERAFSVLEDCDGANPGDVLREGDRPLKTEANK
jgi:NAD(P)-dependent dehydrogenase (short-subunit alcohol dehydrogenase family)